MNITKPIVIHINNQFFIIDGYWLVDNKYDVKQYDSYNQMAKELKVPKSTFMNKISEAISAATYYE